MIKKEKLSCAVMTAKYWGEYRYLLKFRNARGEASNRSILLLLPPQYNPSPEGLNSASSPPVPSPWHAYHTKVVCLKNYVLSVGGGYFMTGQILQGIYCARICQHLMRVVGDRVGVWKSMLNEGYDWVQYGEGSIGKSVFQKVGREVREFLDRNLGSEDDEEILMQVSAGIQIVEKFERERVIASGKTKGAFFQGFKGPESDDFYRVTKGRKIEEGKR